MTFPPHSLASRRRGFLTPLINGTLSSNGAAVSETLIRSRKGCEKTAQRLFER